MDFPPVFRFPRAPDVPRVVPVGLAAKKKDPQPNSPNKMSFPSHVTPIAGVSAAAGLAISTLGAALSTLGAALQTLGSGLQTLGSAMGMLGGLAMGLAMMGSGT